MFPADGEHRIDFAASPKTFENIEAIEVFYLPSYSPELNPDEYLNCHLKAGGHSGAPARSAGKLKTKAISHLRMLQKRPERVSKYFKHLKIHFAA